MIFSKSNFAWVCDRIFMQQPKLQIVRTNVQDKEYIKTLCMLVHLFLHRKFLFCCQLSLKVFNSKHSQSTRRWVCNFLVCCAKWPHDIYDIYLQYLYKGKCRSHYAIQESQKRDFSLRKQNSINIGKRQEQIIVFLDERRRI